MSPDIFLWIPLGILREIPIEFFQKLLQDFLLENATGIPPAISPVIIAKNPPGTALEIYPEILHKFLRFLQRFSRDSSRNTSLGSSRVSLYILGIYLGIINDISPCI